MILLPSKEGNEPTINKEIMEIPDKNVNVAVQNWKAFMENIFNAV
jgi:hypothetical protein